MITDKFGQPIFDESDLYNLVMQGKDVTALSGMIVDHSVDIEKIANLLENPENLITWTFPHNSDLSVPAWDSMRQQEWHMPESYKLLDIAEHVLSLCVTDAELQRCGQELMLFQERNLFNLLRYLTYLVDVMRKNHLIWGVGRGSSVASYVLFKLGVHRIDSMYYELDPTEFLR